MEKQVACSICGRQFQTARPNRKYCSFSCKEAGAKLQRMKWKNKNADYMKNYMQQYRTTQKKG